VESFRGRIENEEVRIEKGTLKGLVLGGTISIVEGSTNNLAKINEFDNTIAAQTI
jgi:hypothetical protein